MRAIYVSSENITQDKLNEYADRLSVGNALVLEMKPVSGNPCGTRRHRPR